MELKIAFVIITISISNILAVNNSYSQYARLSLDMENATLEEVMDEIERQSEFYFVFNQKKIDVNRVVDIKADQKLITDILPDLFGGTDVHYVFLDRNILLTTESLGSTLSALKDNPQQNVVQGAVTDRNGEPLIGVNVVATGTTIGTLTDINGKYSIEIPHGAKSLTFSFVGMETREITIGVLTQINVTLLESAIGLDEVVVVGYGTMKKSDLTASITSISNEDIKTASITSSTLDHLMTGMAAGVHVAQRTGTPGGGLEVRIRGIGSISAGNEPLYVVDGFPIEGGWNRDLNPLSTINPNDIESVEILKDASAVAIYGSRGSNGVVLITTKQGTSGKNRIEFNVYYGIQEVAHKVDLMNAQEYAEYAIESRNNYWIDRGGLASDPNDVRIYSSAKIPPEWMNSSSLGEGTDWQDEVFQKAPVKNYQLTFSGGNDKMRYLVSGGYYDQKGLIINTGFERYSLRINFENKLTKKFKIGFNLAPSYRSNDVLPVEGGVWGSSILGSVASMPPTLPVFNEDGTYTHLLSPTPYNLGVINSPVTIANKIDGGRTSYSTIGTMYGEYEIIKDLTFKSSIAINYSEFRNSFYSPSDLGHDGQAPPLPATADEADSRDFNWLNENTLTYNKSFNENHTINVLLGYTSQKERNDYTFLAATNFPNDLVHTLNAGTVDNGRTTANEWSLISYLGRIHYNYKSKYLLTASIRRDGSSRFGANNKWGTFPSASAGWNIVNEDFMKAIPFISNLRLRASWGLAGNNNIGNYASVALLSSSSAVFGSGGGTVVRGLQPSALSNENLGWEKMEQYDIGLDLGIIKNRLSFMVDYYNKNTTDLLLNVPVPLSTGYTTALQNIGKVNNKGWEFSFDSKNLVNKFKWSTNFNISFDRNKVVALGPEGDPIIVNASGFTPKTHITRIGDPIGSFWGHIALGVYMDQEDLDNNPKVAGTTYGSHVGDIKFKDIDGDEAITSSDVTVIGDCYPDFIYGFTNRFSFKNINLSIQMDGVEGVDIMNGEYRNIIYVNGVYPRSDMLNRWQSPENPGDGKIPRANRVPSGQNFGYVSTHLLEDASYLRIRNVTLTYSLPEKLINSLNYLTGVTLSFTAQNLYTFTKYLGYNPEASYYGSASTTNVLAPGVNFNSYPIPRSYMFGLNVIF